MDDILLVVLNAFELVDVTVEEQKHLRDPVSVNPFVVEIWVFRKKLVGHVDVGRNERHHVGLIDCFVDV
jgi:hypothetical protein